MTKKIIFNEKEYELEILYSTQSYCFRVVGIGGFNTLPTGFNTLPKECLTDLDKFKQLIIQAINNHHHHDLKVIETWDGII